MYRVFRYLGALLSLSLLSSCYFNSAGHIVHAAAYNAAVDVGDLNKESGFVYSDGKNAYVELTRYRFEDPVQTQYGIIFKPTEEKPTLTPTGQALSGRTRNISGSTAAMMPSAAALKRALPDK